MCNGDGSWVMDGICVAWIVDSIHSDRFVSSCLALPCLSFQLHDLDLGRYAFFSLPDLFMQACMRVTSYGCKV